MGHMQVTWPYPGLSQTLKLSFSEEPFGRLRINSATENLESGAFLIPRTLVRRYARNDTKRQYANDKNRCLAKASSLGLLIPSSHSLDNHALAWGSVRVLCAVAVELVTCSALPISWRYLSLDCQHRIVYNVLKNLRRRREETASTPDIDKNTHADSAGMSS